MAVFVEGLRSQGSVRAITLRCIVNISSGTNEQTQALLDAGLLSHMSRLLGDSSVEVRCPTPLHRVSFRGWLVWQFETSWRCALRMCTTVAQGSLLDDE